MSKKYFKIKHGLEVSGSVLNTSGSRVGIGVAVSPTDTSILRVHGDISSSGNWHMQDSTRSRTLQIDSSKTNIITDGGTLGINSGSIESVEIGNPHFNEARSPYGIYVDATNKSVGINTNTIGVSGLTISGSISASNQNLILGTPKEYNAGIDKNSLYMKDKTVETLKIHTNHTGTVSIYTGSVKPHTVLSKNGLGIGGHPTEALTVDGNISASGDIDFKGSLINKSGLILPSNQVQSLSTSRRIKIATKINGNVDGDDLTIEGGNAFAEDGATGKDGGNLILAGGKKINGGEPGKIIIQGDGYVSQLSSSGEIKAATGSFDNLSITNTDINPNNVNAREVSASIVSASQGIFTTGSVDYLDTYEIRVGHPASGSDSEAFIGHHKSIFKWPIEVRNENDNFRRLLFKNYSGELQPANIHARPFKIHTKHGDLENNIFIVTSTFRGNMGWVGVNTPHPRYAFDVFATASAGGSGTYNNIGFGLERVADNVAMKIKNRVSSSYIVQNGDILSIGSFSGSNGTTWGNNAQARQNLNWKRQTNKTALFGGDLHYLGVGTNNPQYPLDVSGSLRATGNISASKALYVQENAKVGGNLTVEGVLSAHSYHNIYEQSTTVFTTGSTKFGDADVDKHQFTGSLRVLSSTGSNAGGPHYISSGSVGIGTTTPSSSLHIGSHHSNILNLTRKDPWAAGGLYYNWKVNIGDVGELGIQNSYGVNVFKSQNVTSATGPTVFVKSDGNVGIQTENAVKELTVSGSISASGQLFVEGGTSVEDTDITFGKQGYINTSGSKHLFLRPGGSLAQGIEHLYVYSDSIIQGNLTASKGILAKSTDGIISYGKIWASGSASGIVSGSTLRASGTVYGSTANMGNVTVLVGGKVTSDKVQAGSGAGLSLFEDGGSGIFVKDGGDVGIGTTAPTKKLQVTGDISASTDVFVGGKIKTKYNDDWIKTTNLFSTHDEYYTTIGGDGLLVNKISASTNIYVGSTIGHLGDDNTQMTFGTDQWIVTAGGQNMLSVEEKTTTDLIHLNPDSGHINTKISANGNTNAFYMTGSTGHIGISTSPSTTHKVNILGGISSSFGDMAFGGAVTASDGVRIKNTNSISWGIESGDGFRNRIYTKVDEYMKFKLNNIDSLEIKPGAIGTVLPISSSGVINSKRLKQDNDNLRWEAPSPHSHMLFISESGHMAIGSNNNLDIPNYGHHKLTLFGDLHIVSSSGARRGISSYDGNLLISSSVTMSGDITFANNRDTTISIPKRTGTGTTAGRNLFISASDAYDTVGTGNHDGGDITLRAGTNTGAGNLGSIFIENNKSVSASGHLHTGTNDGGTNLSVARHGSNKQYGIIKGGLTTEVCGLVLQTRPSALGNWHDTLFISGAANNGHIGINTPFTEIPRELTVSGSVSASGDFYSGNIKLLTSANSMSFHNVVSTGYVSASGNIQADQNIFVGKHTSSPTLTVYNIDNSSGWSLTTKGGIHSYFNPQSLSNTFFGVGTPTPTSMLTVSGGLDVSGSTNVNGNITTPGTITAGDNSSDAHIFSGSLTVSGDIAALPNGKGLILKSPDGTRYRIKVANGGALSTEAV